MEVIYDLLLCIAIFLVGFIWGRNFHKKAGTLYIDTTNDEKISFKFDFTIPPEDLPSETQIRLDVISK